VTDLKSSRQLLPLAIGAVAAAVVLIAIIPVAGRSLIRSFVTVEATETRRHTEQVLSAFDADLRQLAISTRDYAEWDDAEKFARSGTPEFTASNFSKDSLGGLHVDMVRISHADGRVLYSGLLDRSLQTYRSPAPRYLLDETAAYAVATPALARLQPYQRLIQTSDGLMAISVVEIKRSDKSSPTGVHMLFGRLLRAAEIDRIQSVIQLPVHILALPAGSIPDDSGLSAAIRHWVASAPGDGPITLQPTSDTEIEGYALLRTIDHRVAALLACRNTRDILALGYRTTWGLLGSIGALVVAFCVAFGILFWRLSRSLNDQQSADSRYRNIAAQIREAIILVDATDLRIMEANNAAQRVLGLTAKSLLKRTALDVFPDLQQEVLVGAATLEQAPVICQSRLRRADGTFLAFELSVTRLVDAAGAMLCLVGHDISHRKAAEEAQRANQRKLVHLAQHDSLTGLPNRLFLNSKMPRVLKQSVATDRKLALIYLDVDHFKSINDSRGHGYGDLLLKVVAQRLRSSVAAQDVVVRMGGDEFVIVATLLPDLGAVAGLAKRVQLAMAAPMAIGDSEVAVSASMGIAVHPDNGLELESLLKHADIALYQAKEAGRNTHRFFVANMDLQVSEEVALEQALRHAVDSRQIYIEYQPIIDISNGRIASFEALMRWRHPTLGLVPPGKFIPAAEKIGVIAALGQKAIVDVLAQLRQWLDADLPCVPIAVNVAPAQLARGDFAAMAERCAAEAGVDPRWLRFEITESALLQGTEAIIETLHRLRALGCEILIDDFGTGYSSLSYLSRLPVDILKIDRSFVLQLTAKDGNASIISAVIDMARKLGLRTVAEGVETAEQLLLLQQLECNYVQGYLFSRPISAKRCRIMLERLRDQTVQAPVVSEARLRRA
jgi:diguanylate cyclase (GGDEF)-like protein/PAS domain S-box-containing protein